MTRSPTPRDLQTGNRVTIDLFHPEDAPGVSECYRAIYGDSFPMDYVYDPQKIVEYNSRGDHHTVVARTNTGTVVGLAGCFQSAPNPNVYESGQLMLREEYRKFGIAIELARKVGSDLPAQLGAHVKFAEAVCNHVTSQKLALRFGKHPTGLELECMGTENPVKTSLLTVFEVLHDAPHCLYVPAAYLSFVTAMVQQLGVQRTFSPECDSQPGPATDCELTLIRGAGVAKLSVMQAGADWPDVLQDVHRQAGDWIVQVRIDLGAPSATWAIAELNRAGYFLGGYLPQWFGTDGLLMQRLPHEPQYESVKLFPEGAPILEAVRGDRNRVLDT